MRKITNKAVSVILVMALCVSTLWGALIPASAATAGTYLIETDAVASGSKVITYEITLTNPNPSGLTSGKFDLMLGKDIIDDVNFDANGNYVDPTNESIEDFRDRDKDGNFMINGTNVYKTVDVYDEEGQKIGTKEVVDYVIKENEGNKATLLPNAFDSTIGLYDTKIEITGGTRVNDNGFSLSDFTSNYKEFKKGENNTTHAVYAKDTTEGADASLVIDDDNDGRKYIYNMTDNYKLTHLNSNPVTYEEVTVSEGNVTHYAVQDINALD